MGREVKRVPLGFNWPVGKKWWGYLLPNVPCQTCAGTGLVDYKFKGAHDREQPGSWYCPHCEGEKRAYMPSIEVPEGDGWQMWENTSEGSSISPVFETPEELARWLADNGASSFGNDTATYEQWLGMIGVGWAPSAIHSSATGLQSGVAAIAAIEAQKASD